MMNHLITLAVILASVLRSHSAFGVESPKPNVLMIAVDDLNDYVSILRNYPGIKTPNFDRLAKRSVSFTRAFCAAPLCNPSRSAIVTGLAPNTTGIYELNDEIQRSAPALACVSLTEQFKRHGYDTYQTGKFYHGGVANGWPEDRMKAMWTERKPPFSDLGPRLKQGNSVMGKGVYVIGFEPGGFDAMPDMAILKNTKAWLAQKYDRPFFIVHGINKPHVSFVVPKQFYDLYPLDSIVLPEPRGDDYSDIPEYVKPTYLRDLDMEQFAKLHATKEGWMQVLQAYLASISFCDWVVGQLLDALDATPYADNTIVVLWSDHGYHIGEKEKLHKRALWTQTSRVPFLISVPGMKTAGESCPAPVSLLDIYPTLVQLCDLDQKVPQALAGHSLVPLLDAPKAKWPHLTITAGSLGNAAVSDARYHYIRYADGSEELYDDEADPHEVRNVAKEPEMKPVIERLASHLPVTWLPNVGHGKGKSGSTDE